MWFLCPQSKIWKWRSLIHVWLFATPWTVVLGILQTRIMEWVAFPFSRRSSHPRDWTQGSHTAGRFFTNWTTKLWQTIFFQDSWNSVSYPPCWFTKLLWYSTIKKEGLFLSPFESQVWDLWLHWRVQYVGMTSFFSAIAFGFMGSAYCIMEGLLFESLTWTPVSVLWEAWSNGGIVQVF